MPYLTNGPEAGKKRKRVVTDRSSGKSLKTKASKIDDTLKSEGPKARIKRLEAEITESRKHYNNIVELLSIAERSWSKRESHLAAAVALCRVFCRLHTSGSLRKSNTSTDAEATITQWLLERYNEYCDILIAAVHGEDETSQSTAVTLVMTLAKEEGDYAWRHGLFIRLMRTLLTAEGVDTAGEKFVEEFFQPYSDVQVYTFLATAHLLPELRSDENAVQASLNILESLELIPERDEGLHRFYTDSPPKACQAVTPWKKHGQEAWLAVLRSNLSKEQRKAILSIMTPKIVPLFSKAEMLADFLTDSYNTPGSSALLALSGLFYLMANRNLDYPSFYQKLYSLLDSGLLHSKYRSRFFRLLDTFMASTHLPSALVASFIKRLSRLALEAPPAGIVVIVPWIYNMLKKHPACTFMIHRVPRTQTEREQLEQIGSDDPFDMDETDPMETNAIDSCLWEIISLQSHYHPNVAALARIVSQQFTKPSYNLEDFLDYSYQSIVENELRKEIRKDPEVEYEIPKRIFTIQDNDGTNEFGSLMNIVLACQ